MVKLYDNYCELIAIFLLGFSFLIDENYYYLNLVVLFDGIEMVR
jgi:hypothetical protein